MSLCITGLREMKCIFNFSNWWSFLPFWAKLSSSQILIPSCEWAPWSANCLYPFSLTPIAQYFKGIITTEHKHGHSLGGSQRDFISKAVLCSEPKWEANSASFHSYSREQFSPTSPREQETQAGRAAIKRITASSSLEYQNPPFQSSG